MSEEILRSFAASLVNCSIAADHCGWAGQFLTMCEVPWDGEMARVKEVTDRPEYAPLWVNAKVTSFGVAFEVLFYWGAILICLCSVWRT